MAPINIAITKMIITEFDEIFGNSDKQKKICRMTYDICKEKEKTQNEKAQNNQNQ